jgi:hypothetical protein
VSALEFKVAGWLPSDLPDIRERETLSSLRITAGDQPITEVNDVLAHTVRDYIQVPAYPVARWLLLNWWRLRWEAAPAHPSFDWRKSHSMAAISSDYAWPAITFESDGDFIHASARAEPIADVAAVRYLRSVDVRISAREFEHAVDELVDVLELRLSSRVPDESELHELRAELREERSEPVRARACKLQALAGIHPGDAPEHWLQAAMRLANAAGPTAGDEVVAASTTMRDGLAGADRAVEAMRASTWTVKLDPRVDVPLHADDELPWQRGRRLGSAFRAKLGRNAGPLPTAVLEDLLGNRFAAAMPTTATPPVAGSKPLTGGYRNGANHGRTSVAMTISRLTNQRFYVSRLIGAALVSSPADHVLPVSDAGTALQKFERSFAQELLCPWAELDAFTDERGTNEEGVLDAAEHFDVSEYVIISTLVNNGKLSRRRLPDDLA